jgi:hypothetical protein
MMFTNCSSNSFGCLFFRESNGAVQGETSCNHQWAEFSLKN